MSIIGNSGTIDSIVANGVSMDTVYLNASKIWSKPYTIDALEYQQQFNIKQDANEWAGAIRFKPDGSKMYVMVRSPNNHDIKEYSLTTAWNVSTAILNYTYEWNTYSGSYTLFHIAPDGLSNYSLDSNGNLEQYAWGTAWNVLTRTTTKLSELALTQVFGCRIILFKPDGTHLTAIAYDGAFKRYSLSTPWNLSTASLIDSSNLSVLYTIGSGLWSSDGKKLFLHDSANDLLYQYSLSTAYDITTKSLDYTAVGDFGYYTDFSFDFNADGSKLYLKYDDQYTYSYIKEYDV